jgi:hypothetical protein
MSKANSRLYKHATRSNGPKLMLKMSEPTPPQIGDRLFYSLDPKLIALLCQLSHGALDQTILETETLLGNRNESHCTQVGMWKGRTIQYRFLANLPPLLESIGPRPAEWKNDPFWQDIGNWCNPVTIKAVEEKVDRIYSMSAGYCGWLLANPEFVEEHDKFFDMFQKPIREIGALPPMDDRDSIISRSLKRCRNAYELLCTRWELAGLAGPYLPIPLQPHLPVLANALHLLPAMARAGGVFIYFPHSHPLPNRKDLRELIEDARSRASTPAHLKEWAKLVGAKNSGKKGIPHFARLFRLQHWWRVLHHRHWKQASRHMEDLQRALAVFLLGDDPGDTHFETIRDDLTFLTKRRLLSDWLRTSADAREPVADMLQHLEIIDGFIRFGVARGAKQKPPHASSGRSSEATYTIDKKKNEEEVLSEHRSNGSSQPFRCPKFLFDSMTKAMSHADAPMDFSEVMAATAKLYPDPAEFQLRAALRFLLSVTPPIMARDRNRYRAIRRGKFEAEAKAVWTALAKQSK